MVVCPNVIYLIVYLSRKLLVYAQFWCAIISFIACNILDHFLNKSFRNLSRIRHEDWKKLPSRNSRPCARFDFFQFNPIEPFIRGCILPHVWIPQDMSNVEYLMSFFKCFKSIVKFEHLNMNAHKTDPTRDSNLTRQMASLMWTPNPRRLDAKGWQCSDTVIIMLNIILIIEILFNYFIKLV